MPVIRVIPIAMAFNFPAGGNCRNRDFLLNSAVDAGIGNFAVYEGIIFIASSTKDGGGDVARWV